MTHRNLRKFCELGILVGSCLASLHASAPETVTPSLRVSSNNSANAHALENYRLVAVKRVRFAARDTQLRPDERTALNTFAQRFCRSSEMFYEVRGYADETASAEQNLVASTVRANTVARFLTDQCVSPERILIIGLGAIDPAGLVLDPEHQRVDIRILAPSTEAVRAGAHYDSQVGRRSAFPDIQRGEEDFRSLGIENRDHLINHVVLRQQDVQRPLCRERRIDCATATPHWRDCHSF